MLAAGDRDAPTSHRARRLEVDVSPGLELRLQGAQPLAGPPQPQHLDLDLGDVDDHHRVAMERPGGVGHAKLRLQHLEGL